MDGKSAWRNNVFLERFWRTVKYEKVYLKAYGSVAEARSHHPIPEILQLRTSSLIA
jgi:hypothetical protein